MDTLSKKKTQGPKPLAAPPAAQPLPKTTLKTAPAPMSSDNPSGWGVDPASHEVVPSSAAPRKRKPKVEEAPVETEPS